MLYLNVYIYIDYIVIYSLYIKTILLLIVLFYIILILLIKHFGSSQLLV